jgi:protein ImuA
MIEQLRQRLQILQRQALQRTAGIEGDPGALPLGIAAIDEALGGGLARGALHEIAAPGEAHLAAATGFVLGLVSSPSPRANPLSFRGASAASEPGIQGQALYLTSLDSGPGATRRPGMTARNILWIAEDMALTESGALYGPGIEAFNLAPERLLTVAAAHRRDLLWAMEEALRCRTIGAVIGELRHGDIDAVAVRRLSLAAADSGALALLLRSAPVSDASTAATRWIVGAAPSAHGPPRFAAHLIRNRRGPTGSWILQWSDIDERFVLATPAQPVAAPALDRPHRKIA